MASATASPLGRADTWDLVSADYTRDLAPHTAEYAADALDLVTVPDGGRVLDLATGPGTLALGAAARGWRVGAVDFSAAMIGLLRQRATAAGHAARIGACVGNGQALPFADGAFAAAFSVFGLMFFADRAAGLRELHRVLGADGRVVIGSWLPLEDVPALGALFAALRRALPELAIPPAPAPLGRAEEIVAELEAAGFGDAVVHRACHDLVYQSPRHLWAAFARAAAPVALLRRRVGEARWQVVTTAVEGDLAALGEGTLRVAMPAHLAVARRARA